MQLFLQSEYLKGLRNKLNKELFIVCYALILLVFQKAQKYKKMNGERDYFLKGNNLICESVQYDSEYQ